MRIAFFIINNVIGGGGMVATQSAIRMLNNSGHEIYIFLQELVSDKNKHLLNLDNIKYVECGNINAYTGINNLLKKLQENKIEIFITHCHYYLPIIKCFNSIKKFGIKIILNEHHLNFIPIYEKRYELFLERERYLKSVDLITVIEETSYHIWKSKGYPVAILPNTIDNLNYKEGNPQKTILISGRFTDFKQIELGIVAFSLIAAKYPGWTLKILGQGSQLKSIRNVINSCGAKKQISLVGWTKHPEEYFAQAYIHVLPSFTEPFGLVITDAKQYHVPTVMFDIKSNSLIRDNVDGLRIPMGDVKGMAKAIERLICDKALHDRLASNTLENVEENKEENTRKVWLEVINYVNGHSPIDQATYRKYFQRAISPKALNNLIFDYDQLLYWFAKKQYKPKQNAVLKPIQIVKKRFINYIGEVIFKFASKYLSSDRIILWDSNNVAQLEETLGQQSLKLKTVKILPSGLFTPKIAYNLARSKIFITNTNTGAIKRLKNKENGDSIIINVWHGSGYFKKFGVHEANIGELDFKKKYGTPDYVLCSSEQIRNKYAEIFGIPNSRVLPFGSTRSDLFFNKEYIEEKRASFVKKFPNIRQKKVYLIAPTWRGTPFKAETANYYLPVNIEKLKSNLSEDEVIIFKNHQLVNKSKNTNITNSVFDEKFLNGQDCSMSELLINSDVVVTDYSSLLFDALILNKPILMWATDILAYNQEIGFYDNYLDYVPGEVYTEGDPAELLNCIRRAPSFTQSKKYLGLKYKFVSQCDGKASERLKEFINALDVTDYKRRWKHYLNKIKSLEFKLVFDDEKYLAKNFFKLYMPGKSKKIHYELQGRENGRKTYICFHIETKYSIDKAAEDALQDCSKTFLHVSRRGNNFLEICIPTNLENFRNDLIKLHNIVSNFTFIEVDSGINVKLQPQQK